MGDHSVKVTSAGEAHSRNSDWAVFPKESWDGDSSASTRRDIEVADSL